jgi:hypothetical protein
MSLLTTLADANLWVAEIAGRADFPDERLNARFADLLLTFAEKPLDSIPQACGSARDAKAAYRLFSNRRLSVADFLQPIIASTIEGCRGQPTVYSVQDSTSLNYSTLRHTKDLGLLNDSPRARGLHLHTTLALRPDGVPIGPLHQHYWSRPAADLEAPEPKSLSIQDKESFKWLRGVNAAESAVAHLSEDERPRLIHVMDREGDIHEVLERISASPHGAVIRSAQNRSVAGEINKAHDAVAAGPVIGMHRLTVPAQGGQPRRTARLELRAVAMTITPNPDKHPSRRRVTWTLVAANEVDAPAGVEPLRWLLWTTEPAQTRAQIIEVLRIYTLRWRIEDYHLTLKSGCRAEALELETAARLTKALILYSAVAVRIVALRDLARTEPEAPCTRVLSDLAWRALYAHFEKRLPKADTPTPTVRQAVLWIGRLGGHLNRKRDGMPGVRTLWRGWRDLTIMMAGYRLGQQQCGAGDLR